MAATLDRNNCCYHPPLVVTPGVVNNLKSQTTTHFIITGGTVYTTPPQCNSIPPRVIKIPNRKCYHVGCDIRCHTKVHGRVVVGGWWMAVLLRYVCTVFLLVYCCGLPGHFFSPTPGAATV